MARPNTIIAGVNKAGTTSLFVSLTAHPEVAPSAIKETRYFLPARYGRPLEPVLVYDAYVTAGDDQPVRLEATPAYFYGGKPLVDRITEVCDEPKVIVVLREPVSRLVSFFTYQQARLRIPATMTLEEYIAHADAMSPEVFSTDPEAEKWFGIRGGFYADYLSSWRDVLGDRFRVVFFDDLMQRPEPLLRDLATWLNIDPERYPEVDLSSENRTTGFRNRAFQRVALSVNDRGERFLRKHYRMKRWARTVYYRLNGRSARPIVSDELRAELQERYQEPNLRLAEQLRHTGVELPPWLETPVPA